MKLCNETRWFEMNKKKCHELPLSFPYNYNWKTNKLLPICNTTYRVVLSHICHLTFNLKKIITKAWKLGRRQFIDAIVVSTMGLSTIHWSNKPVYITLINKFVTSINKFISSKFINSIIKLIASEIFILYFNKQVH